MNDDAGDADAGVRALDELPDAQAAAALRACCGASAWIDGMVAQRPFVSVVRLRALADSVWNGLRADEWLEAFAHHPRIGEQASAAAQDACAQGWSSGEQSGMHDADDAMRRSLASANAAYEARFGYICIICASGKQSSELLAITRARLDNDADAERVIAAEEQRKIIQLRLVKLVLDLSRQTSP